MIEIPGMLMVGARCKADGKTAFICGIIERFCSQADITAIKISTVDSVNTSHHPGIGSGYKGGRPLLPYRITDQKGRLGQTDTARMLTAGARKVLWLEALNEYLEQGISELAGKLGNQTVTVCESNRARRFIEPDSFVMITGPQEKAWKPSAMDVMREADRIVRSQGDEFDIAPQDIQLLKGRWTVRMQATAIVLADSDNARTGSGRTASADSKSRVLKSLCTSLMPWFTEVIVCAGGLIKYTLDGMTVVRRELYGGKLLVDIASALRASASEVNFVIGCDSSEISDSLMRSMLRQAVDCDAVVPATNHADDRRTCVVFRKSIIPFIEAAVRAGGNRIIDVLGRCRVKSVTKHPEFDASSLSQELLSNPLRDGFEKDCTS